MSNSASSRGRCILRAVLSILGDAISSPSRHLHDAVTWYQPLGLLAGEPAAAIGVMQWRHRVCLVARSPLPEHQ